MGLRVAGRDKTVGDERFLQILLEADDPVLGTTEIADIVGFSTNTGAQNRLDELEDRGLVGSKRIGNGLAWWITDRGRELLEDEGEAT